MPQAEPNHQEEQANMQSKRNHHIQLSVVVPVLNEAETLPRLFAEMARQRKVSLELVVADGGSTDGTVAAADGLKREARFPVTIMETEQGRGRQLNRGATAATAERLLFLHADSTFPQETALRAALDCLDTNGEGNSGGKFRLRFRRSETTRSFGYYFYESKARLLRRECTHGDQGLLVSRELFEEAGRFREDCGMLAETRFADRVHSMGGWTLLPAEIETSARRFETEGLRERQTLNAIIMNFAAQQWDLFFQRIPDLYRPHDTSARLPLPNLVRGVLDLLGSLPAPERRRRWLATGAYVRGNAWQIAFALDAYRNYRNRLPAGLGPTPMLEHYDRNLDRLTDHAAGHLLTALLVWLWARGSCMRVHRAEETGPAMSRP